ncbi:SET domain-containing protein [Aspergillus affinis]|uniref:SET domain-containing protein n=1 Tax=Aspergillus affinis TaxID=1070780 RepID=UPI0022FE0374|nr:SET domain-containing protein [Aspergillus affinis]KAI9036992.1 SET domain-containing protein [Aspergillus affinis]
MLIELSFHEYLVCITSCVEAADSSFYLNLPGAEFCHPIRGCIDLNDGKLVPPARLTPDQSKDDVEPLTPQSMVDEACSRSSKRRKTVSGLRLAPFKSTASLNEEELEKDNQDTSVPGSGVSDPQTASIRQVHSDTGFPQRKKPGDSSVPVMEPTSTDKLISGIWRQVFSPVQLSRLPSVCGMIEPSINIRTGVSGDVFRAVNTLCLKYYNQSQSSRALEMVVQAYWIECYEARIAVIRLQNPNLSITEARMIALKETCAVLKWKEKDLRNRMAIWRGYKEIKDAGGWASLIFASAGVYRFCKYRTGFGEGLSTRLRHIRSSLELAVDTLHPEWRDLLQVIGQVEAPRYHGHPHEWVTVTGEPAVPLASTYAHLHLPNGFQYQFIDECVIDCAAFGTDDPRQVPGPDPETCPVCAQRQSDEIEKNQCTCFPALFGGIRGTVPVQLFRTTSGKNNGVVARTSIDRGTAIGEFIGLVTNGISGVDVMQGGSHKKQTYQIYQGQMGNFTRFINHSCRPNSQFQRFYWRGKERIVVVSRGVVAGSEITVDYSNQYWNQLDKKCLCGEMVVVDGGGGRKKEEA